MKIRDLMAVLGVAAVTAAVTLPVMRPARLGADDAATEIIPEVTQPQLELDGCLFVLTSDKTQYAPGRDAAPFHRSDQPHRSVGRDQPVGQHLGG